MFNQFSTDNPQSDAMQTAEEQFDGDMEDLRPEEFSSENCPEDQDEYYVSVVAVCATSDGLNWWAKDWTYKSDADSCISTLVKKHNEECGCGSESNIEFHVDLID